MDGDHLGALLPQALARLGHRPALTYRDAASGERTELSGATLANWVAKSANHLVEELGVAPGDEVALRAGLHWRVVVALFSAWCAGAVVALGGDGPGFAVTDDVLSEPDEFDAPPVAPDAPAMIDVDGRTWTHAEVVARAARRQPPRRLLVTAAPASVDAWAASVVAPLLAGGAVVLLVGADADTVAAVAAAEGATPAQADGGSGR